MNKQELVAHLKQSVESIDELLNAAQLQNDLKDFNPEQVQVIEAIAQLVATKQAKTCKEAGELYRKPQREAQLNDLAARHQIAPDRIPEILKAMKLKPETLTDTQLAQYMEVCQKLQSGVELLDAVPKTNGSRAKKASGPDNTPESENGTTSESAIALTSSNAIANLEVSEEQQATLRDMADALAPEAVPDLAKEMVQAAGEVSGDLKQVTKQIFMEAALKQLKTQDNDPQRAVEMFRKLKRGEQI
jgi:uncharacterized coiled-coil DUF342 family protein